MNLYVILAYEDSNYSGSERIVYCSNDRHKVENKLLEFELDNLKQQILVERCESCSAKYNTIEYFDCDRFCLGTDNDGSFMCENYCREIDSSKYYIRELWCDFNEDLIHSCDSI